MPRRLGSSATLRVLVIGLGAAVTLAGGTRSWADDLPTPPVPPEHATVAENAPVPDTGAGLPQKPASEQPNVNIKLYRSQTYDPSTGFTPGSRYQSTEDRKPIQTPGLSLTVPLQ